MSIIRQGVVDFYKNKNILITGSTGLLGTGLVEKLVRSFPQVNKIFLLARKKKSESFDERCRKYFDKKLDSPILLFFGRLPITEKGRLTTLKKSWPKREYPINDQKNVSHVPLVNPQNSILHTEVESVSLYLEIGVKLFTEVFTRAKQMNPNYSSKIVWLNGDLTASKNLGLSTLDLDKIENEVNIVFHCAATLNFAEPLKQVLRKNLNATNDLLNIFKDSNSLDSFLYISTLYSNTNKNRLHIQEKLYPPFADPFELLKMVDSLTEMEMETKCKHFTQNCLNYYTFSKNISENLVNQFKTEFPVGILRPGIIIGSAYEPIPYWVQGSMALERVLLEVDNGYIFKPNPKARSGAVPVDMVANAMIAAAYDIHNHKNQTNIYNYSANSNPCTYKEVNDYYVKGIDKLKLLRKRLKYNYIVPLTILFNGSSTHAIKRKQFEFFSELLHVPFNDEFVFENNNIHHLWNSLSEEERKLLFFNVDGLNWKCYYGGMSKGRVRDEY